MQVVTRFGKVSIDALWIKISLNNILFESSDQYLWFFTFEFLIFQHKFYEDQVVFLIDVCFDMVVIDMESTLYKLRCSLYLFGQTYMAIELLCQGTNSTKSLS